MTPQLSVSPDTTSPSLRDRNAVHDERGKVGELLRAVAEDPRFSTRQHELRSLAEAIAQGEDPESVWRGVALEQAFSPETTIRLMPRKRRRVAGAIGALAAIVVFLPVGWTWMSFQAAAHAYQVWLADKADTISPSAAPIQAESFLQLWATGFPGPHSTPLLSQWHWLPSVAGWATFLIALCVLLIVGERLVTRSADRADDTEYQECAARLASALNFAQITINSRRIQEPVQSFEAIQESVEQLLIAHQRTRESAIELRDAADALHKSTGQATETLETSIDALLRSFQQSVNGLMHSLTTSLDGTTSDLLDSVERAAQNLSDSVTHASNTLESSVKTAVGSLNTSVEQVSQASIGMESAVSASANAQGVLADAATGLAANTQALTTSLRDQITNAADAINREVGGLRAEVSGMTQSTGQVDASLGHHTAALQHQITELTQIRASLERVSGLSATGARAGTAAVVAER